MPQLGLEQSRQLTTLKDKYMDNMEKIIAAVNLTQQIINPAIELSDAVIEVYVIQLSRYPIDSALNALGRVQTECKFFSLSEVISRLKDQDGRPGVEEAWGLIKLNESETFPLTDEMAIAFGLALSNYSETGDSVSARMVFKEKYTALIDEARLEARTVNWFMSVGTDRSGVEAPVREALALGRINQEKADEYLPQKDDGVVAKMLSQGGGTALLDNPEGKSFKELVLGSGPDVET